MLHCNKNDFPINCVFNHRLASTYYLVLSRLRLLSLRSVLSLGVSLPRLDSRLGTSRRGDLRSFVSLLRLDDRLDRFRSAGELDRERFLERRRSVRSLSLLKLNKISMSFIVELIVSHNLTLFLKRLAIYTKSNIYLVSLARVIV